MTFQRFAPPLVVIAALLLAAFAIACAGSRAEPTAIPAATPVPAAAADTPMPTEAATAAPAPTEAMAAVTEPPASSPTEEPAEQPAAGAATVFTLGEGTIARYRVEEELANTGFFVAVGETTDVAGAIAFDADGAVVAEASRIVVQAATLRTDSNRRDGYVRNRTLETDSYPEVVFVPTAIDGLSDSIADASGDVAFTITGDLTVKDQTREVTWDATATFAGDGATTGIASVEFTFDDFGMDKPRVAVVLSVDDTIRLELDFVGTLTTQ